jgi:hypothetical protein
LAALASGYPLHHLRPHRFAVSGFGGSASIPLATNVFFLFFHYYNLSLYIMAQDLVLNAGILTLVTEGHLYGDDANDSRIPHFPQNTFYVASAAQFNNLPADAKRYNRGKNFAKGNIVGLKAGGEFVLVDNAPPRHALSPSSYPMNKKVSFGGLQVDATLVTSGGNSGITIGVGSDLGAGGWAVSRIQDVFGNKLLVPEKMVTALTNAAGKIGIPAAHALAQYNMRNVVRLTQQQVCDLLTLQWNSPDSYYLSAAKKGFPQSWNAMHPILHEIVMKIAYGYGNVTAGHADNIRALDASLKSQSELQQLTAFKAALLKDNASSADKFAKFIDVAIDTIQKGGKVTITKDPIKMDELTKASNPTLDIVAKVTGNSKLRSRIETARAQEPEKMKEAMAKLGQTYVPPQTNPVTPNPTPNTDTTNTDTNDSDSTSIVELIKMAMAGKGSIKGKVGVGGDNNTQDVIVIKALLNSHGYYDFTYNPVTLLTEMFTIGKSDAKLEAAITKFQTDKGAKKPDGRVDPNGTTLGWLNGPKATATVETPPVVIPPVVETPPVVTPPVVDTPVVDTPPTNNTSTPQKGEKDAVLFAGCVQMVTEGNLASGGNNDTKRPHYPQNVSYFQQVAAGSGTHTIINPALGVFQISAGGGWQEKQPLDRHNCDGNALKQGDLIMGTYLVSGKVGSSGLTIGQGFDLGAKYPNKDTKAAKKRLTDAGIADDVATQLAATAGIQGVRAAQEASRLRKSGLEISQDNVVNLLRLTVDDYGEKFNMSNIHEALVDTYKAICYARGDGGASKLGLGDLTNKVRGKSNIEQCDLTITWLTEQGFPKHVKHVQRLRDTFANGGNVILSKETFTIEKLMSPDNDMAEWVGAVKGVDFKKQVFAINVQQRLIKDGFLAPTFKNKAGQMVSSADGDFGSGSQAALKKWQTANQVSPTGLIDEPTKTKMFGDILKPNNGGGNTTPVNPVEPPKVTMPALMGDATYGCYH